MSETETLERTDDLIDHAAMQVHQNLLNVLAERVSVANALQRQAQAAYDEAQARYQAAVFGRGGDRHKCKITLEDAARRLIVETESADAARSELQHAHERTQIVSGIAHRKMYEDGIRQRIAASRRWDAAKVAVAAAEAGRAAADLQMRRAMQAGTYDLFGALDHPDPMKSEAEERAHWRSRNINPDKPLHPMHLPAELTDNEAREQGLIKMTKGADVTHVHPSAVAAHAASGWSG